MHEDKQEIETWSVTKRQEERKTEMTSTKLGKTTKVYISFSRPSKSPYLNKVYCQKKLEFTS